MQAMQNDGVSMKSLSRARFRKRARGAGEAPVPHLTDTIPYRLPRFPRHPMARLVPSGASFASALLSLGKRVFSYFAAAFRFGRRDDDHRRAPVLFWPLLVLTALLLSCEQRTEGLNGEAAIAPTPRETVERLAKENERIALSSTPHHLQLYPEEIRRILERGQVVFGIVSTEQKPFFYKDEESGQLIGVDVEIAYEIANRLGVRAVFDREAASFDDVVLKVASKEVDIALGKLSRTLKRTAMVRFTHPYIAFRQALLFNRLELAKVSSEENLPMFVKRFSGNIGITKNTSYIEYAEVNFPNATIKPYDTWEECVDALFAGEALAVYGDESAMLIVTETRKNAAILVKTVFISDKQDPIVMAVAHDAPLLEAWLNTFLDEYLRQNSEELAARQIVKKHLEEK
jgi:ABC-type amino acid transport substrate-binding protein